MKRILQFTSRAPDPAATGALDSSGRYRIELCEGWTGCSDGTQFIGFNNKTCVAGVPPVSKSYGNTVGPLLRSSGVSNKWRTWVVDVVSKKADSTIVTIKNDFDQARCTGHFIDDYSEKKDACKGTVWAERVHMHKFPGQWTVRPAKGTDGKCFNIINHEKPVGCLRYLSARADCNERHLKLDKRDDGSGLQRWKFVRVGGATPSPSVPALPGSTCVSTGPANCAGCCKSKFEKMDGSYLDDQSCVDTAEYPQCDFDIGPVPPPSPGVLPSPTPSPAKSLTIMSTFSGSPTAGKVVFRPEPGAETCTVTATSAGIAVSTSVGHPISFPTTTVTLNGLDPDVLYEISVSCKDASGKTYSNSNSKSMHTRPTYAHPGVVNLHATSSSSAAFHIVAPDATQCDPERYDVFWGIPGTPRQQQTSVTQVDVSLTALSPNTMYEVTVDAVCKGGSITKRSSPAFVTIPPVSPTPGPPPPGPTPPVPPTILDKAPTIQSYSMTGPHPEVTLALNGTVPTGATAVVDVTCTPPAGFATNASVPASIPVSTMHLPVGLPAGSTCTLTAYTQSGSKTSPKATSTTSTPASATEAPSLSPWVPNYIDQSGSVDIVPPQNVNCSSAGGIVGYTLGYKMSGASGAPSSVAAKSPGTVTLPDSSVQYGAGQTLELTVAGACADGTVTPQGALAVDVTQCPTIANCQALETSGKCTCAACESGYVASSSGYSCTPAPPAVAPDLKATSMPGSWTCAAWGDEAGLWVLVDWAAFKVSYRKSAVITSPDAINWTHRGPLPGFSCNSIVYGGLSGNKRFVAVGIDGYALVSTDGLTWTEYPQAPAVRLYGVTFGGPAGGELYVAVGVGYILTSPDGATWTSRTVPKPFADIAVPPYFRGVAWGDGKFVAVAESSPRTIFQTFPVPGMRVATSPDGVTWTLRDAGAVAEHEWWDIAYGGPQGAEMFVAIASDGNGIGMTSKDGITWSPLVLPSAWVYFRFRSISYSEGRFTIVGDSAYDYFVSTDGVKWTMGKFNPPSAEFKASAEWGGQTKDTLVIGGLEGAILTNV